ncbi:hypothetical protein [Pseudomonas laurentiana]
MARLTEAQSGGANVLRFLDLIAFSEGTSIVKPCDDGYNVLYGGGLFQGYADHPRCKLTFPIYGTPVTSTAVGRYRLLARYWDAYRVSLRLIGGFTPLWAALAGAPRTLWERARPRRIQRGAWHRLRRCSRACPLPQVPHEPDSCAVPVGAGLPAMRSILPPLSNRPFLQNFNLEFSY